jgi:antitoxin component YwqK of YwqJK toxin-antitoxin module
MKKMIMLFFILITVIPALGQITERSGVYYGEDSKPYTGKHFEYNEHGGVAMEVNLVNGVFEGTSMVFSPEGILTE